MFSKQQKQGWKSGNTAVEFALIAPVMLTILAGIVDYGLQIHYQAELQTAVRAGAQYATGTGRATDVAGITSTIQNASDLTSIVVATPASVCRCSNGVLVACTGATCGDGSAVGAYLDLSATYSYTPLLSFYAPSRTLSFAMSVRTS